MAGRLEGKVALITGSSSGIGAASAELFAQEGAKVVGNANTTVEDGQRVVNAILEAGGEAIFVRGDVSREADCKRLVEATVEAFGRVDILFCNAGVSTTVPLEDTTEQEFDRVMGVNVKGVFFCCKYALPHMRRQGSGVILTTSSRAAYVPSFTRPLYAGSKAAALQITQSIGIECAEDNIRACTLMPGMIRTRMMNRFEANSPDPEAAHQWHENAQPMGRTGTAEECAHAALFLASDDASFVTAVPLIVDGGYTYS
jgi:NAD(P)-dependent dehydrogenase (short-subunit alcohol dehydrogenase family)